MDTRAAWNAESCIRRAVAERGLTPDVVGLVDTKAVHEAASRWADCAFDYGDWMVRPKGSGRSGKGFWPHGAVRAGTS